MMKPEPNDLFSNSRGAPPPGTRGMKRLKNSNAGSLSSKGKGDPAACARLTCVVLILTTVGPCFSARSAKSGKARVCAIAREQTSHIDTTARRRFMNGLPPKRISNEKRYRDDPRHFQAGNGSEHTQRQAIDHPAPREFPPDHRQAAFRARRPAHRPTTERHRRGLQKRARSRIRYRSTPARQPLHRSGFPPDRPWARCITSESGSARHSRLFHDNGRTRPAQPPQVRSRPPRHALSHAPYYDRLPSSHFQLPAAIRRRIQQGTQFGRHCLAGPKNTGTDRPDRTIHGSGNLFVGQPLDFAQDDGCTQFIRQRLHRGVHGFANLFRHQDTLRRIDVPQLPGILETLGFLAIEFGCRGRTTPLRYQIIFGRIDANAIHPRIKRTVAAKGRQGAVGLDKRLLRHILDFCCVADIARQQAAQLALVLAHQLIEGTLVTALRTFDQGLIDLALTHESRSLGSCCRYGSWPQYSAEVFHPPITMSAYL